MAVSATVISTGSWTDFSVQTQQSMGTLSQAPAVGDRLFFVLASTVSANISPGGSGWGGIDTLYDNQGNVWNRDTPTGALNTGDNTTTEIWSCYVKYAIPTTGYVLNVTPDSRGLSAWWRLIDVSGLAEASDGSVSPLDKVAQADEAPGTGTTTFVSGTTGTLSTSDTWCLAAFGVAGAPTAPWATDVNGFTRLGSDQSGSAPGSARGLSVWSKEVTATTGVSESVTLSTPFSGSGVIATYKVGSSTPSTSGIRPVVHQQATTASATSLTSTAVDTTGCDLLIVPAATWHTSGQTSTISDSKSNTWTLVPTTVPATSGLAKMYVWYAWNPSVGTGHTVTITSSKSASEITFSLNGFKGSQTSANPLDQKNTNTGSSATGTPGSVTTTTDGELYFSAITEDAGTTTINTSGWVEPDDVSANQDLHTQWQVAAHQTVNPAETFVGGSTTFAGVIGTFKPGSGGSTDSVAWSTTGKSAPSFSIQKTDGIALSTTGKSAPSFGVGRVEPISFSSTGKSTPVFGLVGNVVISVAATGKSAPAFTVALHGIDPITFSTMGHSSPAFSLQRTRTRVFATTGTSSPSFAVSGGAVTAIPQTHLSIGLNALQIN